MIRDNLDARARVAVSTMFVCLAGCDDPECGDDVHYKEDGNANEDEEVQQMTMAWRCRC